MQNINPFKPNSPVPTAMFAGRYEEIAALDKGLFQTKNGYGANFLITGERGIGKSSLMMMLKHTARGTVTSFNSHKFNFVTINIVISDRTDLVTLIKLIERQINREIGKLEIIRKFLTKTWEFVQRIKVLDSGINQAEQDTNSDVLINDFAYSLSETCKRVINPQNEEEAKDGIVFLFDEVDNACADLRIGYFFKVVTELLQQNDCDNVMFAVAGLPDVVEKLSISHESSVRIFTQLKIKELAVEDRKYVIDKGIEEGNKINTTQITIANDAKEQISNLSEGYPHFIQQFAYSAYESNSDNEITDMDVLAGAAIKGGAIDAIGDRYYASAYHDKIKSDEYREVLEIMAESMNSWIKKSEIRNKFSGKDQTLTDALQALTARKIILKNLSKMGEYRLQQRGFALWIKLFGNREK